ncbi:hypothetical protein PIB30_060204 [Stylosanthes scabra]|uniref:Uncharacterized protein n=1 Tax=Stylosanthes scabra TaxID=79078 RepID=A0ABU6QL25_9FABA|nr:hypothetical protein [Stylosanthes scabra]
MAVDLGKKIYTCRFWQITGEALWERSRFNKPLAPPVKRKPGCLQKKRKKDADEKDSGSKKPKDQTKMSMKYREFTSAKNAGNKPPANEVDINHQQQPPVTEIDITQPNYSQPLMMEEKPTAPDPTTRTRPDKLPLKRRPTQPTQYPNMDPMQGASAGTAKRMSEIIKLIPTPGFIPPRKK